MMFESKILLSHFGPVCRNLKSLYLIIDVSIKDGTFKKATDAMFVFIYKMETLHFSSWWVRIVFFLTLLNLKHDN